MPGRGIGAACARELARRDHAMVLMSRTGSAAAVADELGGIAPLRCRKEFVGTD